MLNHRTILSIRGHSSQKSRLASSLLIPIFPDSNSREEPNENTAISVQNGVMSFTLSGEYIKGALNSHFFFGAVVMCNSSRRRRGSWLWWNPTFITRRRFQPCSQIGPFPQVGVKIENTWNHHLAKVLLHTFFSRTTPLTKILRNLQNTLHPKQIPLNPTPVSKTTEGKSRLKNYWSCRPNQFSKNPQLGGGCFNPFSKSTCLV